MLIKIVFYFIKRGLIIKYISGAKWGRVGDRDIRKDGDTGVLIQIIKREGNIL